jgi:hypothetical protein
MMYLQTGNCFQNGSWLRYGPDAFSISSQTYVQHFAQHPAALGYYIMDECFDSLIQETEQHYQQLKSWDPQGLSLATLLAVAYQDPSAWINAADILATNPYPLYNVVGTAEPPQGYPHFIVADFTARLRWVARPDRPIWSVLQFFRSSVESRLPTSSEMRAHAVMAVVEGAQGLFWWQIGTYGLRDGTLDPTTVNTWMGYLQGLTSELAGLEPALLAPNADHMLVGNTTRFANPVAGRISQLDHNLAVDQLQSRKDGYQAEKAALQAGDTSKSPLVIGAANVRTRTKFVGGVGYVFAYNYTNQQQPVTFTWWSPLSRVKESQSGQLYTVNGASWSDTFGPYESRIYVVREHSARDFNRDTKSDILWRQTSGTVAVWLLDGPTVIGSGTLGAPAADWQIAGVGDFNGDGYADILWRHNSGAVAVWLLNGTTVIGSGVPGAAGTDWQIAGVGDFNGDGKADILWRHASGAVAVWLLNGTTVIGSALPGTASSDWQIVGVGDFNGDRKPDILWRNTGTGLVAIWLMNGVTISSTANVTTIASGWTPVVADFDGDSRADILWRNTSSGDVVLWVMNGPTILANIAVGNVATVWSLAEVGDFNGDGKPDVLWRHSSSGDITMWLNSGLNQQPNMTFVSNVSLDWVIQ